MGRASFQENLAAFGSEQYSKALNPDEHTLLSLSLMLLRL